MTAGLRDAPPGTTGSTRLAAVADWVLAASRSARWRAIAWAAFAGVLTLSALLFGLDHRTDDTWVLMLDLLATAPLAAVRSWPTASISAVNGANCVFVVWGHLPWPPPAVFAWLLALAACPLVLRRVPAVMMLIAAEVAAVAGAVAPGSVNPRPWDTPITEAITVLLVWGAGETVRARRESQAQRVHAAAELRSERKRAAAALGRSEIARELHDIVAHHVSLIAVRAATAKYQLPHASPDELEAFEEIATRARVALDELRAVLGVLRDPAASTLHAPQPGSAELPALLGSMRSSGMHVIADVPGVAETADLSAAAQLCCYRVVQEALTNAARHAPGADVKLTVGRRDDDVVVEIVNPTVAGTARPPEERPGFGLVGMRERVTALGGTLEVGNDAAHFQVRATIPARPS